ncbi:hypothetical protein ETAA8_08770 [Anatilimnocola aggregata]|uniref:SIR2-like domain-containing protein n=1 Tax=Anatilimnocola aggregata TaxID=2528021 RepID=A0A517Y6E9_9BACT|nr:hypothetical protein [Anatilimnocola aggregata]QDU25805.1 hypothetical protein ETAA8_08770 [Anatilimnocola aggregata]
MFDKQTVLVLGAGASCQYGYPLGGKLVEDLIGLHNNEFMRNELALIGKTCEHYKVFEQVLKEAMPPSIDFFLETRPDFIEMGKLAIAYKILVHEGPNITARGIKSAWYHMLLDALGNTPAKIIANKLSIVTFNYDRSLEHFLHTAIKARFNLNDVQAAEVVASIPIVHVYGQIGLLPWQKGADDAKLPWGCAGTTGTALKASKSIKIICEENTHESPTLVQSRQLLAEADTTYILGFGFHEENCLRLGLDQKSGSRQGGRYGLSDARVYILEQKYGLKLHGQQDSDIPWLLENCKRYLASSSG